MSGQADNFAPTSNAQNVIDDDCTNRAVARLDSSQSAQQRQGIEPLERVALESVGQGVWEINHATGERYFSEKWYSMRGLQPGASASLPFQDWIVNVHPDDQEAIRESIRLQHEFGLDDLTHEYRERHADGHWIWILSQSRIVARDESGNSLRTVGSDTDITSLKTTGEKNRRISSWMTRALASASIGVWTFNINTKAMFWDKRLREFYGIDAHIEVTSAMWENAIHPDDRDRASSTADKSINDHGSCWNDFRVVRPDGSTIHIRRRASYYYDPDEGPLLVGVNWDVTDEYIRAAELERAKAEADAARAAMEFNALHDALTGLNNRRSLDAELDALSRRGHDGSVALLLIDLDRFKQINDSLGHAAGDALLRHVAIILMAEVNESDCVARTGGDEFVVVVRQVLDKSRVVALAEKLLERLNGPFFYEGHDCRFGGSIGIAFSGNGEVNGQQMLANADFALYRAKKAGRNTFSIFNPEMQAAVSRNKRMAGELLTGLERGEFVPYYQLQFHAHSREVAGAEALIRWQHPELGLLDPGDFLQIAEDAGALARLDEVILYQGLADLASWQSRGVKVPSLSVNVSAKRLRDRNVINQLRDIIFPKGRLSFELNESTLIDNNHDESIAANIVQLRALGVGIEVDNFGTGHASIAGLLRLRPDRLKIDRHLVRPIMGSVEQRRLLRSMIDIGKSLGIVVVAEGVETMDHAAVLTDLGCDILQGFAFCRPMAGSEVADFVLRGAGATQPLSVTRAIA